MVNRNKFTNSTDYYEAEAREAKTMELPEDIRAVIEDRFDDLMMDVGTSMSELRENAYEVALLAYEKGLEAGVSRNV